MELGSLYHKKWISAEAAAFLIKNGQNLVLGMGVGQPAALMKALAKRVREGSLTHLPIYYMHGSHAALETLLIPELMDIVKPHSMFMSHHDRDLANKGLAQNKRWVNYVPCTFHQAGKLLTDEIGVDTLIVNTSRMNSAGYFSLGTNADYAATVIQKCKRIIVEAIVICRL
jgi:itaconate CoA-transferase